MARRKRRTFSPDDKVAILKKHLVDGVPISEVCDEHELQPNQFYTWQRQFFENGAAAFAPKKPGGQRAPAGEESREARAEARSQGRGHR
jgi:transposase-like protein